MLEEPVPSVTSLHSKEITASGQFSALSSLRLNDEPLPYTVTGRSNLETGYPFDAVFYLHGLGGNNKCFFEINHIAQNTVDPTDLFRHR